MLEPAPHPVAAIVDRLLAVRHRLRWSQEEMGERLDLTTEAYRALEKGRTVRLEWETILLLMGLLDECGLSIEWFFGRGKSATAPAAAGAEADPPAVDSPVGQMYAALDRATAALLSEEAARPPLPEPVLKVPGKRRPRGYRKLEQAAAPVQTGIPVLSLGDVVRCMQADGTVVAPESAERIQTAGSATPGAFAVRIVGSSLTGGYADGDLVVCAPGQPVASGPGLLVLRSRECVPATWRAAASGKLRVTPLDADLPPRTVTAADVTAAFTVVGRHPRSV